MAHVWDKFCTDQRPSLQRVSHRLFILQPLQIHLRGEPMRRLHARRILRFLIAGVVFMTPTGFAQTTPSHAPPNTPITKRIEGALARIDGNELLLKVKGGTTETYQLSPSVQLVLARPGLMSDLSSGKSVGCTSIYNQDGKVLAGECHLYTDGSHEFSGDHAIAGASSTPVISGTITAVRDNVEAAKGSARSILIQIAGEQGATTVIVSSLTQITVTRPGDASALKPGAAVHGISEQAVDGTGVIQMLTIMSSPQGKPG